MTKIPSHISNQSKPTVDSNNPRPNPNAQPSAPGQQSRRDSQAYGAAQGQAAPAQHQPHCLDLSHHNEQVRGLLSNIQCETASSIHGEKIRTAMQAIEAEPILHYYYNAIDENLRNSVDERQFWPPEYGDPGQCASVDEYHNVQARYILGALLYILTNNKPEIYKIKEGYENPSMDPMQRDRMHSFLAMMKNNHAVLRGAKIIEHIAFELLDPDYRKRPTIDQAVKSIREFIDEQLFSLHGSEIQVVDIRHLNQYTDGAGEGVSLAHAAARENSLFTMKQIFEAGLPIDTYNSDGFTPLHRAIQSRAKKVVDALLNRGVDINRRSKQGETALHDEMRNVYEWESKGHCTSDLSTRLKWVISLGVDVNIPFPDGTPPLIYAIEKGSLLLLDTLIQTNKGKGVDIFCEKEGKSCLHFSILEPKRAFYKVEMLVRVVQIIFNRLNDGSEEFPLERFINDRNHSSKDGECAATLLALRMADKKMGGELIGDRDRRLYFSIAFVAFMFHDQHYLTRTPISSEAVSVYNSELKSIIPDSEVVSEEAFQKTLIKEFIGIIRQWWLPEIGGELIGPIPVINGEELIAIDENITGMLSTRRFTFEYLDDDGRFQVGMDGGGLKCQAIGEAWYQIFNHPKCFNEEEVQQWSLFKSIGDGDPYHELPAEVPSTNDKRYDRYQFLGQLMALSARMGIPSPVQLSPELFKRIERLCVAVSDYQLLKNDVSKVPRSPLTLCGVPADWSNFSVKNMLNDLCENDFGFILKLLNMDGENLGAYEGEISNGKGGVPFSLEQARFQLKEALYDWLLSGESNQRGQVVQLMQSLGSDIRNEASEVELTNALCNWELPSSKALALEGLKNEAYAVLGIPSIIALGIAKNPQAMNNFLILGPHATRVAVCGTSNLRASLIESIAEPVIPSNQMDQKSKALCNKRLHITHAVKSFIKQAKSSELNTLTLFWTGNRQLGNMSRLVITINPEEKMSPENIRSRTCFNELIVPLRLAYSDSGDPLSQKHVNEALSEFLSLPISILSQFDYEPG